MDYVSKILSEYSISGVIFTSFYMFCTLLAPNIFFFRRNTRRVPFNSKVLWVVISLIWQVMILYSFKVHVDSPEQIDSHYYTYNLFVKGGWYNFQKWMESYAQDVFSDIILLSFMLILPVGVFDKLDGYEKIILVLSKIGFLFLFLNFVLGPPKYVIENKPLTFDRYLNTVLGLKGDVANGYYNFFNKNWLSIMKILLAIVFITALGWL